MDVPLKKIGGQASAEFGQEGLEESFNFSEIVEQLAGFVRRQFPIFVFMGACSVILGLVYLFTAPPSFTAHTMLLIDSSKVRILQQQPLGDVPIDTAQVETQVEILKSENIGLSVVKDLKLTDDPEFTGHGGGLLGSIVGLFVSPEARSETALTRSALDAFKDKRAITRVARTYVLDIAFTSYNAARSAVIANAIADAYIVDQLESKYQATKRASVWLQDRIKELRKQASDADRAVLDYKENNNIISVGPSGISGGPRLLGEQQLEDLNTQLGNARAAAEDAKARLERIDDVMQRDVTDATVTDSLKSEVINRLRNQYLDIAAKESIWSARYGKDHLAAVNLRTQMAELRKSIRDELGRIAEGYKSDYAIAKSRVEGLEQELQKLVTRSQVTNRDRLGLTDLESTAKVYHSIYDNFLQRYMEAIQQESFPITEARVIGTAAPPEHKSSPLPTRVLGIAVAIGFILSFIVAFLRDSVDRVFRSERQVEANLHANCLAVLPSLVSRNRAKEAISLLGARLDTRPDKAIAPTKVTQPELDDIGKRADTLGKRVIKPSRPFMRQVIEEPLSDFAESFRSIKVALDVSRSCVIGVTSTVAAEGKTTVSSNLAELLARAGKRVILLDGDLRNPSLTRALAANAKAGLLQVISGQATLDDAIYMDEETGLRFLPVVTSARAVYADEVLGSDRFKSFIDRLREDYDYILIDFSPIAPIVDVRASAEVVDSYIYVIEWGQTQISFVKHQIARFPALYDRLLGVVLNKADVRVRARYESYYYGKKYYGQYPYVPNN
jgi:polysaccharide biosynthesis transport protein